MSRRRSGGQPPQRKTRCGARKASAPSPHSEEGPTPARAPEPIAATGGSKPAAIRPALIRIEPGLHIVATPIGNLADITLRALEVLRRADVIACEDTRVTGKLRAAYGIATPMTPYHDHNAERARPALIERLKHGDIVALVSDAGTPLISDPGYRLVTAAIAEGIPVTAVPGPSAPMAAMVLSGLPTDRFLYAGFLPPRSAARQKALAAVAEIDASLVFLESPRRLAAALEDMARMLGNRAAAVGRELTKLHEEVRRGALEELALHYQGAGPPKGEAVIVVGPPERAGDGKADAASLDAALRHAMAGMSVRDAARFVATSTGISRGTVYARALTLAAEELDDADH